MKILAIGTNLGECEDNLNRAIELLKRYILVLKRSNIYCSRAWGKEDQPDFMNMVVSISTDKTPWEMLEIIQKIEGQMGRVRKEKWGPRLIDIDIVIWDDIEIKGAELTIPHSYLNDRDFFLIPAIEIAPGIKDPRSGQLFSQLLNAIPEEKRTI